jgi:hypothetical protein
VWCSALPGEQLALLRPGVPAVLSAQEEWAGSAARWVASAERRVPEKALLEASGEMEPGAERQREAPAECAADPASVGRLGPVGRYLPDVYLPDVARSAQDVALALPQEALPGEEQGGPAYQGPAADAGARQELAREGPVRAPGSMDAVGVREHQPGAAPVQRVPRPGGMACPALPGARPGASARDWDAVRPGRHRGWLREEHGEPRYHRLDRRHAARAGRLPHCFQGVPACAEVAHRRHPDQGEREVATGRVRRARPEPK